MLRHATLLSWCLFDTAKPPGRVCQPLPDLQTQLHTDTRLYIPRGCRSDFLSHIQTRMCIRALGGPGFPVYSHRHGLAGQSPWLWDAGLGSHSCSEPQGPGRGGGFMDCCCWAMRPWMCVWRPINMCDMTTGRHELCSPASPFSADGLATLWAERSAPNTHTNLRIHRKFCVPHVTPFNMSDPWSTASLPGFFLQLSLRKLSLRNRAWGWGDSGAARELGGFGVGMGKPRRDGSWGSPWLVVPLILTVPCSPLGPAPGSWGRGSARPISNDPSPLGREAMATASPWSQVAVVEPSLSFCHSLHHFLSPGLFATPSVSTSARLSSFLFVHPLP